MTPIEISTLAESPIFWSAVGSIATAGALLVSSLLLAIQMRDRRKEKKKGERSSAEHVSGWLEVKYKKKITEDGKEKLEKQVKVLLKNTGNQPVYDVTMLAAEQVPGQGFTKLGNLGLPTIIPTLPPEDANEWDISSQIKHYDIGPYLYLETSFRDSANRHWKRDYSGKLTKINPRKSKYRKVKKEELDKQIGFHSEKNPFSVATAFYALATSDSPEEWSQALELTTPESEWGDAKEIHDFLEGLGMTTYLEYPTDGVAYVRFVTPQKTNVVVESAHLGPVVQAKIMTLQFREEFDTWKVHSIGLPCPPEFLPAKPIER